MAKIVRIVSVSRPDYDGQEATCENGESLTLITNIARQEVYKYELLIRSFNSHAKFGIFHEAWGFNEEEGHGFKCSGCGLYVDDREQLERFWKHDDRIKHVHKYHPGYKAGYLFYNLIRVKKPKTNAQRRRAKRPRLDRKPKTFTYMTRSQFPEQGCPGCLYRAQDTNTLYLFTQGSYNDILGNQEHIAAILSNKHMGII